MAKNKQYIPIYEFIQVFMANAKTSKEVVTVADAVQACKLWQNSLIKGK